MKYGEIEVYYVGDEFPLTVGKLKEIIKDIPNEWFIEYDDGQVYREIWKLIHKRYRTEKSYEDVLYIT
jgi:hypothetical protein